MDGTRNAPRAPLDGEVVRLDGGTSTTLEARGADLSGPLWSARLLLESPGTIEAIHGEFLRAGAEVVTTLTYQLSGPGLTAAGHPADDLPGLTARAVTLARDAARAHRLAAGREDAPTPRVVGALGPYAATLGGGREYVGGYEVTTGALVGFHAPRVAAMLAAGVDVVRFATVPSRDELVAIAEVVAGTGTPVWVSATTDATGTATPEGTPLDEAFAPLLDVPEVTAIGVNCVAPDRVVPALERLAVLGRPLLAAPNVAASFDPDHGAWRRHAEVADPRPWVAAGARLVGACCGTTPDDLARLHAQLATP